MIYSTVAGLLGWAIERLSRSDDEMRKRKAINWKLQHEHEVGRRSGRWGLVGTGANWRWPIDNTKWHLMASRWPVGSDIDAVVTAIRVDPLTAGPFPPNLGPLSPLLGAPVLFDFLFFLFLLLDSYCFRCSGCFRLGIGWAQRAHIWRCVCVCRFN